MKRIFAFVGMLLLFVSCNQDLELDQEVQEPQVKKAGELVFHASFEGSSAPETKVFMNDDWKLCWNAKDLISVFYKTNDNLQFGFSGEDGDPAGDFSAVVREKEIKGNEVPHIYAIYPYAGNTSVAADGSISLTLPAQQAYGGGVSFGRDANTMISVTEEEKDDFLFKNVCGYLQLKLYGDDVSISKVTLKGNSNEPLAGSAVITVASDGVPTISKWVSTATEVSVVCEKPVVLGEKEKDYTTFMLAIPPTTFEKGFTITVTDSDGYVVEKSTQNSYTVKRNQIFPMAPVKCRTIETFQIENTGTQKYLADNTYDYYPSDYTKSVITDYTQYGSDDPNPFEVRVSGASQITLHDISGYYPDGHWTATVSSGKIQVYNLIPGVVYHYEVLDSQKSVVKQGFVRPEGKVRWIYGVTGNMRDLGGWKATDGTIAYGKLFRGRELDGIGDNGKTIFLQNLGLSVDLDLRGYDTGTPSQPMGAACTYENLKVWQFLGNGSGTTEALYRQALRDIIKWLGAGKAVYFHCIGGADRTGTLAFLIEALVGVSEADLSRDYELTTFYPGHERRRNATSGSYIYTWLINYIQKFEGNTLNEKVASWATTGENALTSEEIALLHDYLVVKQ